MNRISRSCVSIACAVAALACCADPVRIGTWNIRVGDDNEPSWPSRKDALVAQFEELDIDAGGFQEVAPGQMAFLREKLLQYEIIGDHREKDRVSGEASPVFWRKDRYEAEKTGTFWVSPTPDIPGSKGWDAQCRRVCSWALLKDKATGERFCLASCHADHVGVKSRARGLPLAVEKVMDNAGDVPVVFLGDHNCRETDSGAKNVAKMLDNVLYVSETAPTGPWRTMTRFVYLPPEEETTCAEALRLPLSERNEQSGAPDAYADKTGREPPREKHGARIDYIYVSHGVRVMGVETDGETLPGTKSYASDHFPVVAKIDLGAWKRGIRMGTPFADNMVLQRGMPVPVWGWAAPGERVTVEFAGQEKSSIADGEGRWSVALDAMEVSKENRTMRISGAGSPVEIKNVLVGEVWFASGQSNMEVAIWGPNPRYRDAQGGVMTRMTRRPLVRFAKNRQRWSATPLEHWKARWLDYSPESFSEVFDKSLSAVAFYYALELHDATGMPIGIIDSSWGGTRIEPWIPSSAFAKTPHPSATSPVGAMQSTACWNGMVASYAPMAMRGFIWYQGCSNHKESTEEYLGKMRMLYKGWSSEFHNDNLKLYLVQLAPYSSSWFNVQLAQAAFAAEEPNAAISTTCDIGNSHDIHPNDKETVGRRLALHALKRDYGFDDIIDDPPTLRKWRVENGRFVLSFNDANAWYVYRQDAKKDAPGFEIAGEDGVWHPARICNKTHGDGTIDGEELVIGSDEVAGPVQLRYLASKPWEGFLYSFDSGIPLGPFEINKD